MTKRFIDLSHPLEVATPPWPGNPPVDVDVISAIPAERGPAALAARGAGILQHDGVPHLQPHGHPYGCAGPFLQRRGDHRAGAA